MKGLICITLASLALSCGEGSNNNSASLDASVKKVSCCELTEQLYKQEESFKFSCSDIPDKCYIKPLTRLDNDFCEIFIGLADLSEADYLSTIKRYKEQCPYACETGFQ